MTRYLVNEEGLNFHKALGGQQAISEHAEKMLDFAEDLFCKSFGLKPSPIPKCLQAPYLRLIGKYMIVKRIFQIFPPFFKKISKMYHFLISIDY